MDDYLVLVLENQERFPAVDPEQVRRKLEEQGAPGEVREEQRETSGKAGTSARQKNGGAEERPEGKSDAADNKTVAETEHPSASGREAQEAQTGEETLRQMDKALREEGLRRKQNRQDDPQTRAGIEEDAPVSDREMLPPPGAEKTLPDSRDREQKEGKTADGAREILRRLEAAEHRVGEQPAGEQRRSSERKGSAVEMGTASTLAAPEETEYPRAVKAYLQQISGAIARREETRILRVTEQTLRQEQTASNRRGTKTSAYQIQWGEVDPEGLSRIFQRDARRYS